nr:Conserved hypothetical protein [Methylocystis sp. SC2]
MSPSTVIVAINATLLGRARKLVPPTGAAEPRAPETMGASVASAVAYGGLIDAIAGIAITGLAICGLAKILPPAMAASATVILDVTLLIQFVSELVQLTSRSSTEAEKGRSGLLTVLLAGGTGVVLGVLGLIKTDVHVLISVAVISYGMSAILGGSAARRLYELRVSFMEGMDGRGFTGSHILERKLISGAATVQALGGLAAIVLGVVALGRPINQMALNLAALLTLGGKLAIAGSAMVTARTLFI